MTIKQAINWLDLAKGNVEALKMAKEALEKQIPKKPTWNNIYYCPTCGHIICANSGAMPHCYTCGQSIDWSDDDD